MVDSVPEGQGYTLARFSFSRRPIAGRRTLRIAYSTVQAQITWPDGDFETLDRFVAGLNQIVAAVRSEMNVSDQMRDLDSEISALLTSEDDAE